MREANYRKGEWSSTETILAMHIHIQLEPTLIGARLPLYPLCITSSNFDSAWHFNWIVSLYWQRRKSLRPSQLCYPINGTIKVRLSSSLQEYNSRN